MTSKSGWSSELYILQSMIGYIDNCYQTNIIFISGYIEIIFTARCIYFVLILTKKLEEVILVHHYDLFLPNFGSHDSTAQNKAG